MASLKAVIVDPDGTVRKADVEDTLAAFQAVVGGYIEPVCGVNTTIYVNEEGLIMGLPYNDAASLFAQRVLGLGVMLHGTALILGPADGEGNDTHVHPSVVDYYILEN